MANAKKQKISEDDLLENPPTMWRTKLRSGRPDVDPAEQEEYCFSRGKIGVGWARDSWESGTNFDEIFRLVESEDHDGWRRRAALTINRFANEAQINDLVWVRNLDGLFRVCQIRDGWKFDNSEAARRVDIHQVRTVAWSDKEFTSLEVPGAVVRAFAGRQSSFQRIKDRDARAYAVELWNDSIGAGRKNRPKAKDPLRRLDPIDLEDLLYVWFQYELGYLVVPGERSPSTPKYEWILIHRDTGKIAVVQVKSGETEVDVEELHETAKAMKAKAFVFSPEGHYSVKGKRGVTYIDPIEIRKFGFDNPRLLPTRVRYWFERSERP